MPIISIALMGLFAFSGTPQVPMEALSSAIEAEAVDSNATLALKDAAVLTRPEGATEPFSVLLTAYNAVPEQTDGNPSVTASGADSNPEVVAAVSKDLRYGALPFGTVIAIERAGKDTEGCRFNGVSHLIGYRVVADSMHSRKRTQVDVLLNPADTVVVHGKETNPAIALGLCREVSIRVIGTIDMKEIPETQEELQAIVEGEKVARK